MHTIGDGPVETQYQQQMRAVAETIDEFLNGTERPKKIGYIVMMFAFEDGPGVGRMNYMSNANRDDVKTALKEQLAAFGGMPQQTGRA